MAELDIFNLEKIKETLQPIQDLQNNLIKSINISSKFKELKNQFEPYESLDYNDKKLENLFTYTEKLSNELIKISRFNINSLLTYQERLLKRYKVQYKRNFIKLDLDQNKIKNLGLNLIRRKKISKILKSISFISSISIYQWVELIESLRENSLFKKSIKNVAIFYDDFIQNKLDKILEGLPQDIEKTVIDEFQIAFKKDPSLSFRTFFDDYQHNLSDKALRKRKEIIKRTKKKEELEKFKKKQEEQSQIYEDYLNLSPKEFERRRRKKKREKLSEINPKGTPSKELEISDEISEKIEQFKSKFDKKYQEDILKDEDDQQDPLDLIRSRKKKKFEEFEKYKKHFKNKNSEKEIN